MNIEEHVFQPCFIHTATSRTLLHLHLHPHLRLRLPPHPQLQRRSTCLAPKFATASVRAPPPGAHAPSRRASRVLSARSGGPLARTQGTARRARAGSPACRSAPRRARGPTRCSTASARCRSGSSSRWRRSCEFFFFCGAAGVLERGRRRRRKKAHSLSLSLQKKKKKKFCSRESYSWRNTLTSESAAWRTFVKEEIHAMGLAL